MSIYTQVWKLFNTWWSKYSLHRRLIYSTKSIPNFYYIINMPKIIKHVHIFGCMWFLLAPLCHKCNHLPYIGKHAQNLLELFLYSPIFWDSIVLFDCQFKKMKFLVSNKSGIANVTYNKVDYYKILICVYIIACIRNVGNAAMTIEIFQAEFKFDWFNRRVNVKSDKSNM